jgi:hypothetical protein
VDFINFILIAPPPPTPFTPHHHHHPSLIFMIIGRSWSACILESKRAKEAKEEDHKGKNVRQKMMMEELQQAG